MAITNGYITLSEVKARLSPPISVTTWDTELESAIEAACRAIDEIITARRRCMTRFYTTGSDETRYYTARFEDLCVVDDLLSVTSVKTDTNGDGTYDTTLTNYWQMPLNNTLDTGEPSYALQIKPGATSFSMLPMGVQVVGTFGFATAAPKAIRDAAFLAAARLWARRDSLFGNTGTAAIATDTVVDSIATDPEIMLLLNAIPSRPRGLHL